MTYVQDGMRMLGDGRVLVTGHDDQGPVHQYFASMGAFVQAAFCGGAVFVRGPAPLDDEPGGLTP